MRDLLGQAERILKRSKIKPVERSKKQRNDERYSGLFEAKKRRIDQKHQAGFTRLQGSAVA
jgi:hypothetical protein